jgi:hypothetical protein
MSKRIYALCPAGFNGYEYLSNNPINYDNPSGHVASAGGDGGNLMSIQRYTQEEFPLNGKDAYNKIFQEMESIGEVIFTGEIECKGILYPTSTVLSSREIEALLEAIKVYDEDYVFISSIRRNEKNKELIIDWKIDIDSLEIYPSLNELYHGLENAIYSPRGNWGIYLSLDDSGVIGGSEEFITRFYNQLGETIEDITKNFLRDFWEPGKREENLKIYLMSLYGVEKGRSFYKYLG